LAAIRAHPVRSIVAPHDPGAVPLASADGGTTGTGDPGSGTITTLDAHSITGTLDASFAPPPGHLSGPFTATACEPDAG